MKLWRLGAFIADDSSLHLTDTLPSRLGPVVNSVTLFEALRAAGDWSRHHFEWRCIDKKRWPIETLEQLGLDVNDRLVPARSFAAYAFDIYSAFQVAAVDGFRELVRSWDIDFVLDPEHPPPGIRRP